MPLAFLQAQPGQLLALVAAQINWKGHACFLAGAQPQELFRLAAAQSGAGGVLLGQVDDVGGEVTNWLRLQPVAAEARVVGQKSASCIFDPGANFLSWHEADVHTVGSLGCRVA